MKHKSDSFNSLFYLIVEKERETDREGRKIYLRSIFMFHQHPNDFHSGQSLSCNLLSGGFG